ncbi:membrane protein A25C [Aotine betaherpesvirus 1]|uniref:Membrane protein A25C n=1 Tax=Aotine betaherpesvirus 1 TaxID=50290 RepID=G8XUJ5_9BETA|nr:membrane protein A25C [Aotine betaherpesvirus 1]AEV80836.1 membrane protein A25C [Aotine betaherpesvirus 1]
MAHVLTITVTVIFSPWPVTARSVSHLCAAVGNRTVDNPEAAVTELPPLSCIFPRVVGAIVGLHLYPDRQPWPRQPYSIMYHTTAANLSNVVNNATALANVSIVLTMQIDTIVLAFETKVTGTFDCVFNREPKEFIKVSLDYTRLPLMVGISGPNRVYAYACARKCHSHQGVTYTGPLPRPIHRLLLTTTCQDDNETVTVQDASFHELGRFCKQMSILCLDAVGNIWIPQTLRRYGRPPQCVRNRTIVPRSDLSMGSWPRRYKPASSGVTRDRASASTVTRVRQRGHYTVFTAVLNMITVSGIVLLLIIFKITIVQHTHRHSSSWRHRLPGKNSISRLKRSHDGTRNSQHFPIKRHKS